MRMAYDFSPLFRSSIGFDRIFDLLEQTARAQAADNWPPYDIEKLGDDQYRVTLAVAGFGPDELKVTMEPNLLVVSGAKPEAGDREYLHRGITRHEFERRFELADYVEVTRAVFENGLLVIELVRELPEEMRPRRIGIQSGRGAQAGPQLIEDKQRAA